MSAWDAARAELRAVVAAAKPDWSVTAEVPERAAPPLAIIDFPAPPYVDFEGATFGGRNLYLEVVIAVPKGTNDITATAVNEALESVLDAIEDSDSFVPTSVDAGPVSVNGQVYSGGVIRCQTEVHRG